MKKIFDSRNYDKCWSKVTTCLKSSLDHQKYEDGPPKELLSEETLEFIANELMPVFKAILEDEELREVPLLNIDRKSHSCTSLCVSTFRAKPFAGVRSTDGYCIFSCAMLVGS